VYGQEDTEFFYVVSMNREICNVIAGYCVFGRLCCLYLLLIFSVVIERDLRWGGVLILGAIFI